MAWKNEVTLKFLDIYQKEPIICDLSHKQHKSRNNVYVACKLIQTEFFTECDFECSIKDLREKRDSLITKAAKDVESEFSSIFKYSSLYLQFPK